VRLQELHLRAYGPFTDQRLDLSGGDHGLHVVYGPNEAGKSSALRALRALLYGIPERTQDDFLHAKPELRIGGRLLAADGTELLCYRRKGRKDTLLGPDDQPIADETLSRLLGGVDEALFARLFGIDHEALVSGGQALLDERGREAEALFGSGLGSTAVHSVLQALEQEAAELYLPRASKPLINSQLAHYKQISGQLREASLSARQWDEARKAVAVATEAQEHSEQALRADNQRLAALERIRRTLPGLARRTRLREGLAELGEVPVLAEDFGERHQQAVSKRRLAAASRGKALARLEELRTKIHGLTVSETLLAEADHIDELREQLGSYRKATRDRPGLAVQCGMLEQQARQRLVELGRDSELERVDALRPLLGKRRRATELGGRREALMAAVDKGRQDLAEVEQRLTAEREALERLPEPPPLHGLRRAIDAARRVGDADRALDEAKSRLLRHEESGARELAALGLWSGSLSELSGAPLPVAETVRRFAEEYQAQAERQRLAERDLAEVEAERGRIEEALRALALAGAVPSERELNTARETRDRGWQLLRRQWLDGQDVAVEAHAYAEGRALPAAYEGAVGSADEIADRLRREAQRVHEQAAAQARLETCRRRAEAGGTELGRLAEARRDLEQSWQAAWSPCGIVALPPREMTDWLQRAARLREAVGQGDDLRQQIDDLRLARDGHLRALEVGLAAAGEPATQFTELGPVLSHAAARLGALEELARRRTALQESIQALEEIARRLTLALRAAEDQRAAWQSDWSALTGELGLARIPHQPPTADADPSVLTGRIPCGQLDVVSTTPALSSGPCAPSQLRLDALVTNGGEKCGVGAEATPGEVSDYLQTIAEALKLVDEAAELRRRIDGIDAEASRFEADVRKTMARLAPKLAELPAAEAVPQLHSRLGQQRETKSRLEELQTQARQAESELQEADADIRAAVQDLTELCRQAGCPDPEQLEGVHQRYQQHRELQTQLRQVEDELVRGGDGLSIEALAAEAGAAEHDAVLAELTALRQRIVQELQPEREALLERKLNAQHDFDAMTGGDAASELAEQAQQTLAALQALVARYTRVKLARRVLADEIQRFRRRHRDPILARASGYFARLTDGAFAAVETDFDESDQPVLVGVRPSGAHLRVEAMSTGTRDQLYLALRLATLDHYLDESEALPFIVDDILIQFDDARARATLAALADFSNRAQVILYTHHNRVAEEAAKLEGAGDRVLVHRLA